MMYLEAGNKLKIIVETGGANQWKNDVIASDRLLRYHVENKGIFYLQNEYWTEQIAYSPK